ncbi:MAG: GTP-binding protein [Asgard group archaeon]|nr:GTP-binding protein [Asgard group archaeon]
MSLFKKLTKSRDKESGEGTERKTVAIVGLDGAGKTTIVNRLLKSEFTISRPTFGINIEIYKYRTLEFVVYDLGGQSPIRENLWEKFVKSADGLVFVLDSSDKKRFDLAAKEFNNALGYNENAPLLFLSNKIDLEDAASSDEVLKVIDFGRLSRVQRKYNFARCSALTGVHLYESWDWLTNELSLDQNLPKVNVKIIGSYLYTSDGIEVETVIFGKPKTQAKFVDLFKRGGEELKRFLRQMEPYESAETLLAATDSQLIISKKDKYAVGIIIGENEPSARGVQIIKNLHKNIASKINNDETVSVKELLEKHYPLDVFTEN